VSDSEGPGVAIRPPEAPASSGRSKERRRLRPVEALQRDIIAVLTRPAVVGRFWVDLEQAQRFAREPGSSLPHKVPLTPLLVKAAALAAVASPRIHRMFGPWSVVEPEHADVGVSVDGQEILSPVAVLREANRKPLAELAEELKVLAQEARQKEGRDIILVNRYLKLFPFPPLRRLLIRAFWTSPQIRRQAVGTIQFSNIGHFGIESAEVPVVGELLLVCGVLQRKPVVGAQGDVVAGTGAEFTIHGSHRKINGQTAGQFVAAFRRHLAEPQSLL
jgi:pyruvate/2-oxoglutarate dehydrogenase complex dihydrolipoamide acyltransferase (E2) component